MKVIISISLIALGCSYYLLSSPSPSPTTASAPPSPSAQELPPSTEEDLVVEAQISESRFSAKIESNHVEYRVTGEFEGNFRVFGVSPNETEDSPASHISAFVRLVRLEDARTALAREGCERRVAETAKTVAVVATDDRVASQLEEFVPKGGELKLTGRILEVESHEFAGQPLKSFSSGIDLGKIYLLSSVEAASSTGEPAPARSDSNPPAPAQPRVSSEGAGYNWNFSSAEQVRQGKKVAPRPTCKKRRIVRVIRRCPR